MSDPARPNHHRSELPTPAGARLVDILDPQQKPSRRGACGVMRQDRRISMAQMQRTGRRGCETGDQEKRSVLRMPALWDTSVGNAIRLGLSGAMTRQRLANIRRKFSFLRCDTSRVFICSNMSARGAFVSPRITELAKRFRLSEPPSCRSSTSCKA